MKCYPLRIREDKENPNVFKTCLSNYENRMDPFENDEDDTYFTVKKSDEEYEKLMTKYAEYKRFGNEFRREGFKYILDNVDDSLIKGGTLFDFGGGRGVNLDMVVKAGFTTILSLDPSRANHIDYYERLRNI